MNRNELRALAIIPARGGSKGVPRKNIRPLAGRPLIAYTIAAARASQLLTAIVVSTDDDEIAAVAAAEGAPVLKRPPELAADETPMIPVVHHVLRTLPIAASCNVIVILQPTTPLRRGEDIDAALTILRDTHADSVVSVYRVADHHPARMYRLENERLVPYDAEHGFAVRQGLPAVFHRNGAIYACRTELAREKNTLVGGDIRPYLMPRERSVNIDDDLDFRFAEFLFAQGQT